MKKRRIYDNIYYVKQNPFTANDFPNPQERITFLADALSMVVSGETAEVGTRFSLRRPVDSGVFFRDMMLKGDVRTYSGYKRMIVMDINAAGIEPHRKMRRAGLPVAPVLRDMYHPELAFFGVGTGKRLLAREKLHDRDSSGTYIGDKEVFARLGTIYGRAWRATGQLLLDPGTPDDTPLMHAAVGSFSEKEADILMLCPPYQGVDIPSPMEAWERFYDTVAVGLASKGAGVQSTGQLLDAAASAFGEVINHGQM